MNTFTEFAETKNAADFKEIFTQTLAAKVGEALEAKKFEVAQNFFNTEEVEQMDEAASDHGTESNPIVVKTPRGRKIGTVHYSPTGNKGHGIKGPHYVAVHHNHGPYADFEGKTSTQHWESPKGRSAEVRDRAIRSMKRARERVKEEVEQVEECGMSSPILSKKPVWPAASKTVKGIVPKASK